MKARVLTSPEDEGGDRCVDILQVRKQFGWVECRRDPEDSHGWRHLHPHRIRFDGEVDASADALANVGWLAELGWRWQSDPVVLKNCPGPSNT